MFHCPDFECIFSINLISGSYCPGGPDSDFEYSTQSYTGYEVRWVDFTSASIQGSFSIALHNHSPLWKVMHSGLISKKTDWITLLFFLYFSSYFVFFTATKKFCFPKFKIAFNVLILPQFKITFTLHLTAHVHESHPSPIWPLPSDQASGGAGQCICCGICLYIITSVAETSSFSLQSASLMMTIFACPHF